MISVIIPNYNGIKYIGETINSVISQTYTDWEIIIVDDCSTDDSVEVIKRYCNNERIQLIQMRQNRGVANARNRGIEQAQGEYIAFLDNDDIWLPDKLERQVKLLDKGADIVYSSCDFIDELGRTIKKPFLVPQYTNWKKMLVSNVLSCSTCMIRADILKEHHFNPNIYHEDYALWMKLFRLNYKAVGDEKVLMHYRQHNSSRSSNKINAAKERWSIYRRELGLSIPYSAFVFFQYAVKGLKKYR